jgi:hypothetical protein
LFTITIGCPRIFAAAVARGLAQMSVVPPAGYPMRKLMGLAGYFSWAKAPSGMADVQKMNPEKTASQKILLLLISLTMYPSSFVRVTATPFGVKSASFLLYGIIG